MKADGFPTYHLAVVVDDHLMQISHVLRGEEWISSTPKHLLLYRAFGWELPKFAHMPLIRNADHSKISKRKNDVSILSYRDKGYLPEAVINFIALLGWSHPDGKEIFDLKEFLQIMDLTRVQKTGPVFDLEKLNWYNGYYLRKMVEEKGFDDLAAKLAAGGFIPEDFPVEKMAQILPLIYERLVTLSDFQELTNFFWQDPKPEKELLLKKADQETVKSQLDLTRDFLETISWNTEEIEGVIRQLTENKNYKKSQYFMMLRVAITGKKATPPLFETISVLDKETILRRLSLAEKIILT
jgi:glutamyl-tRNA synthetase